MYIQWFPGHMTKALRMMEENVKLVDCLIYVLDSRCIEASFNPKLNELSGGKPILYVLNKADLVSKEDLNAWLDYFRNNKKQVVVCNSANGKTSKVVDGLRILNKNLIEKYKSKGVNRSIRAMVVGIPNSGKSTLINSLCGSKRTITGDRPGVTRGKQWVILSDGIELLDTPGTLWPSFENQEHAKHLAFVGSINEDILNIQELAEEMIEFCRQNNLQNFLQRYKIDSIPEQNSVALEYIAKKRGFLLKGGLLDIERLAKTIIDDFRKGKLGLVMLEKPSNLSEV